MDGSRNTTGRLRGSLTRFKNTYLPVIYRIWCAAHQLALFVQDFMTNCLKESFRDALVAIISYLCRQYTLRQKTLSTFPTFSTTRWSSLRGSTEWIERNNDQITSYIERENQSFNPILQWWAFDAAVKSFMDPIDLLFRSIQGKETTFSEQEAHFSNQATSLMSLARVCGPLDGVCFLTVVC